MVVATSPKYGTFSFPEPTHAFYKDKSPKIRNIQTFTDGLKFQIVNGIGKALHEVVNIDEAISDLPKFDW